MFLEVGEAKKTHDARDVCASRAHESMVATVTHNSSCDLLQSHAAHSLTHHVLSCVK